jgi:hypothetical protein
MYRGIPTLGPRDIQYRSRLEAKYAHLFEFLDWGWDYEPIDLKGYIPDFFVYFEGKPYYKNLLIEIKGEVIKQFREAAEKIFSSGFEGECIFLGSKSPRWSDELKCLQIEGKYVYSVSLASCKKEAWLEFINPLTNL